MHLHTQAVQIYVLLYIIYQYLTLVLMMELQHSLKVNARNINLARHEFWQKCIS